MKTWIINRLCALRATFWFVRPLFGAGAIALAAVALSVTSIGALVCFFHHVSTSIQASEFVAQRPS